MMFKVRSINPKIRIVFIKSGIAFIGSRRSPSHYMGYHVMGVPDLR
jgi:hypothetical protein